MTTITIDRATVEQALEALYQAREFTELYDTEHAAAVNERCHENITALRAALAQQAEAVAADALTEPKSGDKWRVEWWNESCRMMLPAHAKLDSFVAYKNGTIQFTIKRTAA